MDRLKRIYGYVRRYKSGVIRVRTGIPDYSDLPDQNYDWLHTVYGNVDELLPHDMPTPLGNPVRTTTWVDANLYHCKITGRACTGILHLLNQTPIDWFCKRQATVETATFGAEFVAARIATDQIVDLRYSLRMLGVPILHQSFMFGDNKSVVTNSTLPHSTLAKRHHALNYHRVREAVASGFLRFHFVNGKENPADCLTKHNSHAVDWPHIQPLLFWRGETDIPAAK